MPDFLTPSSLFLQKVIKAVEENISDEHYGVSELAEQIHMSRSNLLRKIKKETSLSISVYIRKIRLYHAKALLKNETFSVSEVSYKVGFSSTSYFTKCYRELFGHTPGAAERHHEINESKASEIEQTQKVARNKFFKTVAIGTLSFLLIGALLSFWLRQTAPTKLDKTIAVLPFKNDSADTSNVYLMNGLLEAVLDNFQKIKDIQVTSRTTIEKYRGMAKTIPELARELNVNYFIEGSGQKIGNQILLTIQLIEAPADKRIWSKRYKRELHDIFTLQSEVSRNIAEEIDAVITPEEHQRINKAPTNNLVAYDYYLKGKEYLDDKTGLLLPKSIEYFKKAIAEDGSFAHAYANIAIAYYYSDIFQKEKKYADELRSYAEKAMYLDPELGESLIAKALYYMHLEDYETAILALEDVLTYYPNAGWIHNFLSDIYTSYVPNTDKYLTHALRAVQYSVGEQDSITASFTYLHLGNALIQSGFVKKAQYYTQKSLEYNPNNLFSQYLSVYISYAQDLNIAKAKAGLIHCLQKDTTRLDIIQEIAKICYTMEDYEASWEYYQDFIEIINTYQLDIYQGEDVKIGFVLEQLGQSEKATEYYNNFLAYTQQDQSIYRDLNFTSYYAVKGEVNKAIDHLKVFAQVEGYHYWLVIFLERDPIIQLIADHPDFKKTMKVIRDKFWKRHEVLRNDLEEDNIF